MEKEKSIKQREQMELYIAEKAMIVDDIQKVKDAIKAAKEKEEMWKWIAEVLNEQNSLKASVLDKMNSKF